MPDQYRVGARHDYWIKSGIKLSAGKSGPRPNVCWCRQGKVSAKNAGWCGLEQHPSQRFSRYIRACSDVAGTGLWAEMDVRVSFFAKFWVPFLKRDKTLRAQRWLIPGRGPA